MQANAAGSSGIQHGHGTAAIHAKGACGWMRVRGGGRSRWEEGGAGMWLQQPPNKTHSEWTGSVFVTCPRQQDIGYFCRVCITFGRVSLSALYSHRCGRCGRCGRPYSSGSSSSNSARVLRSDTTISFDWFFFCVCVCRFFFLLASVGTVWKAIKCSLFRLMGSWRADSSSRAMRLSFMQNLPRMIIVSGHSWSACMRANNSSR